MKRKKDSNKVAKNYPDIISSILLLAYGFITVLTPNMRTFDSNGPRFFTLALLNLFVFGYFFFISSERKNRSQLFGFFNSNVGFAYGIMILMALLSFFKAWNVNESILHFAKIFTTFTATWMVCILILRDRKSLLPLAIGMSLLLILDSFHTFQGVKDLVISGKGSILSVKSSYSNKNILTSAIFMKLPFAIWLLYFQKKWSKYLGGIALFLGFSATFFLGARAFLLGTIALSLLLFIYSIIRHRKLENKKYIKIFGAYVLILAIAFGTFAFIQKTAYPKDLSKSAGVGARLSTITDKNNGSNNLRLTAWGQSLQMIRKDPVLGVGIGNWKIRVLEYENSYSPTYTYMYKNHNDFLETTVEYGIIGGLAFIAIFIFTFWYFAKVLFLKRDEETQHLFFLPAIGLVAYSFDAFFNFPQDRPEIQALFAIYVGISAALCLQQWNGDNFLSNFSIKERDTLLLILSIVVGLVLISTSYLLNENIKSLKLQRIIKEELNRGKLKSPSELFLNGFPKIPDITILEEPIAVQKARFLIKEKKFNQAREIMRNDNSNPFDARKEYFTATTFYTEKQYDSTLHYAKKAIKLKPFFYNTNALAAFVYEKKGKLDKSIEIWRNYLKRVKKKEEAWRNAAILLMRQNKLKEAEALIDSACSYLPKSKKLLSLRTNIKQKLIPADELTIFKKAKKLYDKKNYKEAIPLFSQMIKDMPEFAAAYQLRAICYFYLKKHKEAIEDINNYKRINGALPSNMINIRGASYLGLGDRTNAKKDFKKAMKMGDKDGKRNYNMFFKKEDKPISFKVPTKK